MSSGSRNGVESVALPVHCCADPREHVLELPEERLRVRRHLRIRGGVRVRRRRRVAAGDRAAGVVDHDPGGAVLRACHVPRVLDADVGVEPPVDLPHGPRVFQYRLANWSCSFVLRPAPICVIAVFLRVSKPRAGVVEVPEHREREREDRVIGDDRARAAAGRERQRDGPVAIACGSPAATSRAATLSSCDPRSPREAAGCRRRCGTSRPRRRRPRSRVVRLEGRAGRAGSATPGRSCPRRTPRRTRRRAAGPSASGARPARTRSIQS